MNHFLTRTAMLRRGLLATSSGGHGGGSYVSTALASVVLRPSNLAAAADTRCLNDMSFNWRMRMMSSGSEAALTSDKDNGPKKKDEAAKDVEKQTRSSAVVSSYWGVSRPRILREDGSEWPWNCFMV